MTQAGPQRGPPGKGGCAPGLAAAVWTNVTTPCAPGRRAAAGRAGRPRSGAFTLTELLVVIGIVGILAGLVLSVVARGKTRTYPLVCMANLQQFAVALPDVVNTVGTFGEVDPGGEGHC